MLMYTTVFGNLHSWWPHNFPLLAAMISCTQKSRFIYLFILSWLLQNIVLETEAARHGKLSQHHWCGMWDEVKFKIGWRNYDFWPHYQGNVFFFVFFLNSSDGISSSCLESSPADVLSAILRQITACLKFIRPKCSVNISTEKIVRFQMEGTKELPLFGHSCINVPLQTRLTFPVLSQWSSTAPLIHKKIITIQSLAKARSRKKSAATLEKDLIHKESIYICLQHLWRFYNHTSKPPCQDKLPARSERGQSGQWMHHPGWTWRCRRAHRRRPWTIPPWSVSHPVPDRSGCTDLGWWCPSGRLKNTHKHFWSCYKWWEQCCVENLMGP